jgi:branched-subunit amino acid aminotransferase/4-amino-4-deoxychorismate lyase
MGTGPILGLGPAPSYTFCIFAAAVGAYFKGGQLSPIDLLVETKFHRAAPGGMGGTKAAGNYSPVWKKCHLIFPKRRLPLFNLFHFWISLSGELYV